MKKSVLLIGALLIAVGCKKEAAVTENEETLTEDSVTVPETNEPADFASFRTVEFTPEQTSEFLSKKENDTLYVTNFFATWCGPCIREMPHFREKIQQLKGKPVKFTFVSLDEKTDWNTKVKDFAAEHHLQGNIILLDGMKLQPSFFGDNFKQWDGGSIPFTFMRKGDKTDETVGMMTAQMLDEKLNLFLQ